MSLRRPLVVGLLLLALALLALSHLGPWGQQTGPSASLPVYGVSAVTENDRRDLRRFAELFTVGHELYGVEVSYEHLLASSVQGMLHTLDPHSSFRLREAAEDRRRKVQGSIAGIGVNLSVLNGRLTVIRTEEGGPARRLGLLVGDVLSAVDGEPTETMSLAEAVRRITGQTGTEVQLTVTRPGLAAPILLTLPREEVPQPTVPLAYMLDRGTGYVLISSFSQCSG